MAEASLPDRAPADELLSPLTLIRTETVLSKLPIHNLSKKGSIDIRIAKKNAAGDHELLWSVSPSRSHGEPRQLAYKLDTRVINRRIDEAGRPLEKRLRLGSMREICSELELPIGGRSYAEVKRALMQNAFAGITAKVKYRSVEGYERTLEAAFTRYGVIFTGERFPDGERADAVYILFNEPYLEVLNNAPLRPLDYDYLKSLTPGAQRFYEIVSYRIFAALRHELPHAKISYSEYCTYSAQQRYVEYDRVKKQMYKLHRPHLASGYLKTVRIEPLEGGDDEGRPDWMMFYTPGKRSRHEYRVYHQRAGRRLSALKPQGEPVLLEGVAVVVQPEKLPSEPPSAVEVLSPEPGPKQLELELVTPEHLVAYFHKLTKGIENYASFKGSREPGQAAELLDTYGPDKALYVVEYAVQAAKRTRFEMRTFGALTQYVGEAANRYELQKRDRESQRAIRELRDERGRQAEEERGRGELLYAGLSDEERAALRAEVLASMKQDYPNIRTWEGEAMDTAIKAQMVSVIVDRERASRTANKT